MPLLTLPHHGLCATKVSTPGVEAAAAYIHGKMVDLVQLAAALDADVTVDIDSQMVSGAVKMVFLQEVSPQPPDHHPAPPPGSAAAPVPIPMRRQERQRTPLPDAPLCPCGCAAAAGDHQRVPQPYQPHGAHHPQGGRGGPGSDVSVAL